MNERTKDNIITGMLVISLIILITFIVLLIFVVSYRDQILSEPLSYSARHYGIDFCSCPLGDSAWISFNKNSSWISANRLAVLG